MFGLLLFLLNGVAFADLTDDEPTTAITVDAKTDPYVPLTSGTSATFDTPGPQKIMVQSRRRMAGAGQRAKHAPIEVRGDGNPILTIKVSGTAIPDGRIHDRLEGFPSKDDQTLITVPEGGRQLTLTAPPGGPDFFVRVTSRDNPTNLILPVGIAPTQAAPAVATAPVQDAPRSGEQDKKDNTESKPEPKKRQAARNTAPQNELQAGAGMEMGLGIAARGTHMVFHLGATGRYPIYKDLLSVGGSIGWHRIGVEAERPVTHPISGDISYSADWHTDIVPIIARVSVHVPYPPGPLTPIASAGLGAFIATRTDGSTSTTRLAVGPELAVGVEFGLPVGLLQTTISWAEARTQMGNQGTDGQAVAETLATTRLNLAYLYVF